MTLISQVLWGAGFCEVFGFSFTVLRMSTLVLGFIGMGAAYYLFRELGQKRDFSIFLSLLFGFNPFFFSLSYTFMTDVPFFTFSLLSVLFYLKSFKEGALKWVMLGTIFGLTATLVRQLGLMLPLAFSIAWFFKNRHTGKTAFLAIMPFALTLTAFLLYSKWLSATNGLPDGYGDFQKLFKRVGQEGFLIESYKRVGVLIFYCGMFFVPVIPLLVRPSLPKKRWITGLLLIVIAGAFYLAWPRLPWGNVLYNLGLGPKVLKDTYFSINKHPEAPRFVISTVKVIGMFGAVFMFIHFFNAIKALLVQKHVAPIVFALSNVLLYLWFLLLDIHFFDRYYFQLLPFIGICLFAGGAISFSKKAFCLSSVLLLGFALFSIAATHDYLAWNKARWAALNELVKEQNISPHFIDGGFEFNGWYRPGERDYESGRSWWWVDKDDYVVTFGDFPGFGKFKAVPFIRYLPPGVDSIYVLKRE